MNSAVLTYRQPRWIGIEEVNRDAAIEPGKAFPARAPCPDSLPLYLSTPVDSQYDKPLTRNLYHLKSFCFRAIGSRKAPLNERFGEDLAKNA